MILSRKAIVAEEESKKKEETLEAIKVGSVISGKVKRLTNFGAFVDIGGLDGLVHVSEIAWERIKHPGEALKVGEQVEVEVLEVIPEKERISLSIRKTLPDPWLKAVEGLESGQIIKGKVTRLANFGAFIELRPGVEGLAHISQLADFHVKHPSEVLQEGEEVEVKVIEIKPKNKRISLSIKEAGGIAYAGSSFELNGADNGNVTLGDVFGDLFENGDYPAVSEKPVQMAEEDEEKVTEAEKE
jgi:small subunit ribosomal protein S1